MLTRSATNNFELFLGILLSRAAVSADALSCEELTTSNLIDVMRVINDFCLAVPDSTVYFKHAPLTTTETGAVEGEQKTPAIKNVIEAIKKWKGEEKRTANDKRTGMFH